MAWRLYIYPLDIQGEGGLDGPDANGDSRLEVVWPQDLHGLESWGAGGHTIWIIDEPPHRLQRRADLLRALEMQCHAVSCAFPSHGNRKIYQERPLLHRLRPPTG